MAPRVVARGTDPASWDGRRVARAGTWARPGDAGSVIDPVPPEALLAAYPEPMRRIGEDLRALVRDAMPDAIERVRTGWRVLGYDVPVGRRSAYFCWIMPEAVHVHLGFVYGVLMEDPDRLLEGRIPRARWVTFRPGEPIDAPTLVRLVREAARVAHLSHEERLATALDREIWSARPG